MYDGCPEVRNLGTVMLDYGSNYDQIVKGSYGGRLERHSTCCHSSLVPSGRMCGQVSRRVMERQIVTGVPSFPRSLLLTGA